MLVLLLRPSLFTFLISIFTIFSSYSALIRLWCWKDGMLTVEEKDRAPVINISTNFHARKISVQVRE